MQQQQKQIDITNFSTTSASNKSKKRLENETKFEVDNKQLLAKSITLSGKQTTNNNDSNSTTNIINKVRPNNIVSDFSLRTTKAPSSYRRTGPPTRVVPQQRPQRWPTISVVKKKQTLTTTSTTAPTKPAPITTTTTTTPKPVSTTTIDHLRVANKASERIFSQAKVTDIDRSRLKDEISIRPDEISVKKNVASTNGTNIFMDVLFKTASTSSAISIKTPLNKTMQTTTLLPSIVAKANSTQFAPIIKTTITPVKSVTPQVPIKETSDYNQSTSKQQQLQPVLEAKVSQRTNQLPSKERDKSSSNRSKQKVNDTTDANQLPNNKLYRPVFRQQPLPANMLLLPTTVTNINQALYQRRNPQTVLGPRYTTGKSSANQGRNQFAGEHWSLFTRPDGLLSLVEMLVILSNIIIVITIITILSIHCWRVYKKSG